MAAQHTLKPEEFHMQRRAHGIRTSCEMRPEGELVETSHKQWAYHIIYIYNNNNNNNNTNNNNSNDIYIYRKLMERIVCLFLPAM